MNVRVTEDRVHYIDIRLSEVDAKKLHHVLYFSGVLGTLESGLAEKLRELDELKRKED